MTNESLLDKDWDAAVARFGGAEHLENEARALGVFRRVRALKCASDLLRLTLAYCLGSMGLRLTAAWAEAIGLASLSNVALLKRLRSMVPWLEILVARLLAAPAGTAICTQTDNRLIRLVDATTVAKSGRDARSAGGVWRVHAVFDLPSTAREPSSHPVSRTRSSELGSRKSCTRFNKLLVRLTRRISCERLPQGGQDFLRGVLVNVFPPSS